MASRKLEWQIDQSAEREGKSLSRIRELDCKVGQLDRSRGGFLHGRTTRGKDIHAGKPPGRGAHPGEEGCAAYLLAF